MARTIAKRSKDPNTSTGACIVNKDNVIIGLGYNGFPRGCSDDYLPWNREGGFCETKYAYVVHSEANAVLNSNTEVKGAKIYCTLFPCNECVKILIQAGIAEIIYEHDKYHDTDIWKAARIMLNMAGVKYRQFVPENELIFKKNAVTVPAADLPPVKNAERENSNIITQEIPL